MCERRREVGDWKKLISDYHMATRAFQLSEINDETWGYTGPECVYTHDQVPIALCSSHATTVNEKGQDEIYDCAGSDTDMKRFCTLNLCAPMKLS